MDLVSAICPNCNSNLELDIKFEKAFCQYCGSSIYVKEAVEKLRIEVKVDGLSTVDNLLKRAERFFYSKDYEHALLYYERVLDIDIDNVDANAGLEKLLYKGIGNLRLISSASGVIGCPFYINDKKIAHLKFGETLNMPIQYGKYDLIIGNALQAFMCIRKIANVRNFRD